MVRGGAGKCGDYWVGVLIGDAEVPLGGGVVGWFGVPGCGVRRARWGFCFPGKGGGVVVSQGGGERVWAGTEWAETFAFRGEGVLVTDGDRLVEVGRDGEGRVLLEGMGQVRFPGVREGDGAVLVSVRGSGAGEQVWRLVLMERGGVEDLGLGYDGEFVGDGGAIVFEDFSGEGTRVVWMDLGTGERRDLGEGHTVSVGPGGRFAYFSRGGSLMRVYLDEAGAEAERLTEAGEYDRFACVSRDGERVLFFRQLGGRIL